MIDPQKVAVIRQKPDYDPVLVQHSIDQAVSALGFSWSDLIAPGDRVLLKPNFIRESHSGRMDEWQQIITHGSVIRAVAIRVAEALRGKGTITIADAPQTDSNFSKICECTELQKLKRIFQENYPTIALEILDLRRECWQAEHGVIIGRRKLEEDPRGYTLVNLGQESCFAEKNGRFYGADYDIDETIHHHSQGRHEYLLSRSAMDADVFINLPKLKTHKKVGVTLSLKNLVGINGDKNYLPHFCIGTPDEGGDEFPDSHLSAKLQSRLIQTFKHVAKVSGPFTKWWGPSAVRLGGTVFGQTTQVVRSGNWHGNDTAWRMTLDLNRILWHFDGSGERRRTPCRYLSIIDGIVAGEGNGPMEADSKPCGLIIAGTNPVATDLVATKLMGLDWEKVLTIREAFFLQSLPLISFPPDHIQVIPELGEIFRFEPHFGWRGFLEAEPDPHVGDVSEVT